MLVYVFPGQGSQKKGMGQGLFDSIPQFQSIEAQVDQVLGYSMRQLCLEDAQGLLKDTRYTQPALYIVNALHYYQALASGEQPQFLAGHSFGEYNALLAAGCFDLLTGLRMVQKRGELMGRASGGGMAAVIGLEAKRIEDVLTEQALGTLDVANYNSPSQIVISGPTDDIQRAKAALEASGARMVMPLQVSAAFHSRYMQQASQEYAEFLAQFTFRAPQLPVIANVTAQPYPQADATAAIRSLLVRQLTESVRWTQSVRYLLEQGATTFKEMGPGNVLTRLIQQIRA
jgi:malonyl CoA-acyl carrier protein transacylase